MAALRDTPMNQGGLFGRQGPRSLSMRDFESDGAFPVRAPLLGQLSITHTHKGLKTKFSHSLGRKHQTLRPCTPLGHATPLNSP